MGNSGADCALVFTGRGSDCTEPLASATGAGSTGGVERLRVEGRPLLAFGSDAIRACVRRPEGPALLRNAGPGAVFARLT